MSNRPNETLSLQREPSGRVPGQHYVDSKEIYEGDVLCGQIYFNETTRVLKFFCIFCEETYENINYYCEHLSTHIKDEEVTTVEQEEEFLSEEETSEPVAEEDNYYSMPVMADAEVVPYEEVAENTDETVEEQPIKTEEGVEDDAEYVEDENDSSGEFSACEDRAVDQDDDNIIVDESDQLAASEEVSENIVEPTAVEKSRSSDVSCADDTDEAMDFENMIDATNIRSVLPAVAKKKKGKKVTTVKVIAVKNRIAELYDRIKSEGEKRSQMRAYDVVQSAPTTTTTDTEPLDSTQNCEAERIIGETVITLLPESSKPVVAKDARVTSSPSLDPAKAKEKTCPACGMQFRSSFSLTIHKRTHYLESDSEVKLAHKCSDCDRLFNKITEMKVHLERVHYPEGYICKICHKKLSSLTLLEKHMRLVHLNKPFSCTICQKSFETRSLFESHCDTHIEGRNFKCRICGRKYGSEQSMKHHMRRHKEQVPQCCVVCGKMTLRITQHMKIHTPRPKRVLTCKACGKHFNFSSGLSHHYKIMHKQPRPPPKPKRETSGTSASNDGSSNIAAKLKRKTRAAHAKPEDDIAEELQFDEQQQPESLAEGEQKPQKVTTQQQILLPLQIHRLPTGVNLKRPLNPPQLHQTHHIVYQNPRQQQMQQQQQQAQREQQQQQEVNEKEEEAKRVIVELIQNATYTSFLPEHHMNEFEVGPPIAREETITAVNSIVNDC